MIIKVLQIATCLILFVGCDRYEQGGQGEQEARIIYSEALKSWKEGDIATAESKFDQIKEYYPTSAAAILAMQERQKLKNLYKRKFDRIAVKRNNEGNYSKLVFQSIESFFTKQGSYPNTLKEIDLYKYNIGDNLLSSCIYEKALFDYGFSLDCKDADRTVFRRLQNESSSKRANRDRREKELDDLSDYSKATSTWGEKLNPMGFVPDNGFVGFFINTKDPLKIISQSESASIGIKYKLDEFNNIPAKNLGAYWVGNLFLEDDSIKRIVINQTPSITRMIIDGRVVFNRGVDDNFRLELEKGQHRVEVEYTSNYYNTDFSVVFLDEVRRYSVNAIRNRLAVKLTDDYEIYYVGIHKSANNNLSVNLELGKSVKPIVLILSSWEVVKWQISNPSLTRVKAIIYSSQALGSSVSGDIEESVSILSSDTRIGSYVAMSKCTCHKKVYYCDKENLLSMLASVEILSPKKVTGFTVLNLADSIRVPQIALTNGYLKDLRQDIQDDKDNGAACRNGEIPDY